MSISRDRDSSKILAREQQILQHSRNAKDRKKIMGRSLNFDDDFVAPNYPKSQEAIKFLDEALGENFIFSDLTDKERELLINAMQQQEAQEGQMIIRQGDNGDYFYIVEDGTITFVVDGNAVGTCSRGASFGELALLYDAPRAASCIAATDVKLWKVGQGTFRHLLARQAKDQESDIRNLVAKIPLLKDMDRQTVSKFYQVLTIVKFGAGERIVKKGEKGDIFYIVNDGQVKVHDIGMGDSQFVDQILKPGDWFGERALMTGEPRAANVTAMTDVEAFAVDRDTFESTIGPLDQVLGLESKKRFLKGVPIFANSELLEIEYGQLAKKLSEEKFRKGHALAKLGKSSSQKLWIVKEGKLKVSNKEGDIFYIGSGDYFGDKAVRAEGAFVHDHDCVCEEETVCWVLARRHIERIIGDVKRLGQSIPFVPSTVNKSITLSDLQKHRILGMGAFGRVWLVSTADSTAYALKSINKKELIAANQVKGVLREKQIMSSIDHPFILGMIASLQDDYSLYLLLPLIQGGELFNVIHTDKRDGISNSASIFYGACILEALGHLHQRNIVYRDMKPENALIDGQGYCIMVDLGFAKVVVDKTYTLCGTPEYLAPEIIMSKGHDKAVDYWSFGVLVYEMLVGRSPFYFYGTDQISLFKRIVMVKYSCPGTVCEDAKDLIKKLLCRRQSTRLGNLSRGHLDVRDHPWFSSLDFEKLNNKEVQAPWIPNIKNPLDSSHFEDFSKEEREDQNRGRPLGAEEQQIFKDF